MQPALTSRVLALTVGVLALGALGAPRVTAQEAGPGQGQPPPAVIVETVEVVPVGEEVDFIGRIAPIQQVSLRSRVAGFIDEVLFEGGQQVARGDLLFRIEPEQFEAALAAAEAQQSAAQGAYTTAERELRRIRQLLESGTVTEARLDEAESAYQRARGSLLEAEAAVRRARLDLSYTEITAPIDGQMSTPLITAGNYVDTSSGNLAILTQMDPIWGMFPISENQLVTWQRLGLGRGDATASGSAQPAQATAGNPAEESDGRRATDSYVFHLVLPDGSLYEQEGSFQFVDNTVNPSTGTVEARFSFPNPEGYLRPNQNVTLLARERNPPMLPVIPQAAVQLSREGRSVFIVREDDTIERRMIEVDQQEEAGVLAVTEGLSGGESVVVRGALTLQEGAVVSPRQATGASAPGAGASRTGSGNRAPDDEGPPERAAGNGGGREGTGSPE